MPLSRELREFAECLNPNKVEYLIHPTQENAELPLRAIAQFGLRNLDISAGDLTTSGRIIQLGYEPNRIDLMTSVTGVTFEEAWADRSAGQLDGVPVNFIGRAALLRNKEATGRPKDSSRPLVQESGPDAWFRLHAAQEVVFTLLAIPAFRRLATLTSQSAPPERQPT